MNNCVIRADNLGKCYCIGGRQRAHLTLRDSIRDAVAAPFVWAKAGFPWHKKIPNTFWALHEISFEINQGEVVGIIGRNGAGKSTLLKILSRITRPTCGSVEISGRVGSLLEVGTGFHPELTGRENIFLNSAILGMRRTEIRRKFDEIVAFAEVEKFIDTPVKFYSSGMYVRLAFAVAAHLEPEILLVDEVLAVGDIAFQKKSLGKMNDVAREGRTILFVSHNLGAISNLCSTAILLDAGKIIYQGNAATVVTKYQLASNSNGGCIDFVPAQSDAYFTRAAIVNRCGVNAADISVTETFSIHFEYVIKKTLYNCDIAFILFDKNGSRVFTSSLSRTNSDYFAEHAPGNYYAVVSIPSKLLAPGMYTITPVIHQLNVKIFDSREQAIRINIIETGSSEYMFYGGDNGSVLTAFEWNVDRK